MSRRAWRRFGGALLEALAAALLIWAFGMMGYLALHTAPDRPAAGAPR